MSGVSVGLDLGTSGLKGVALASDGGIVAEAEASYTVRTPQAGWAETDPGEWAAALELVLGRLLAQLDADGHQVRSVGVDGQMHGVVLVDGDGVPTRPAVLWPDRRAETQAQRWAALPAEQRERLANPVAAGMAGPMLAWLAEHEPVTVSRARAAVQPKDYLRSLLTPRVVTDRSDASATLMWDVPADEWARDVLDDLGLPTRLLPPVAPSSRVVGHSDLLGLLRAAVPVVVGAADTPAALLAVAGDSQPAAQINLGTGAQVLRPVHRPAPRVDPFTHLYADAHQGWYAMAAVQNAGLALDRARDWLAMGWDEMFDAAESSEPGARGVSFLPFLAGERAGVASSSARGAWLGMHIGTTRADLARSAVEGMLFAVRRASELVDIPEGDVLATGGSVRRPLVVQILADALQRAITVVDVRAASAVGAALLAGEGAGERLAAGSYPRRTVEPRPSSGGLQAYERWASRLPASQV